MPSSSSSSSSIETKSWQKPKFWQTSQFQCKQRIRPKEFVPIILPKNPPKKFLPKNSSKKFLPKNSSKKFSQKNIPPKKSFRKIPKKFQTISQKNPKFWKYPIPYIALRSQKPFWACSVCRFDHSIIEVFSPIAQLLLCQLLSWDKIWEDWEKNENTKSEPVKKWNSTLMPNTLNRGKNSFFVIYVVKDLSMKKRISNIADFRQIYFGFLIVFKT